MENKNYTVATLNEFFGDYTLSTVEEYFEILDRETQKRSQKVAKSLKKYLRQANVQNVSVA